MTNSARLSGRPSSSAAYNVGDVVDTPDSAIKSWRYLGAGEWEPNDAVRYTTSPGGGNRLFAGGDVISKYQDALRFAFPMRFESGSSPARDSSGRGTQLLVSDSAPWDTGWLKGASTQSRRISADALGLDLARDSFVFSFLYKAPAGLTASICGTNSFGTFSETMGYGFFLNINVDKVAARIRCAEASTLSFNGLATVQDGVGHVIQVTWDSSKAEGTLYVDGVKDISGVAVEVDAAALVTVPLQLSGSGGNGNPAHRFAGVQLFVFEGTGLPSSADDLLIKLSSRPREIPVNFL